MAKSFPELTDSGRQMLRGLEANTADDGLDDYEIHVC